MFKEYESKPITRLAYQIREGDSFWQDDNTLLWNLYPEGSPSVSFAAHEEVSLGDWVVYLTEEDTYHCTDKVFRERNVVEETNE